MMNKMNSLNVVRSAVAQLKLGSSPIYDVNIEAMGEELYLSFLTDWMYYELICSGNGQILGISTEPCTFAESKSVCFAYSPTVCA